MPVSAAWNGQPVAIQALDGGTILSVSQPSNTNAVASIGFQGGAKPGLYRIVVTGTGPPAVLQFWIRNTVKPGAYRPPVLNPTH